MIVANGGGVDATLEVVNNICWGAEPGDSHMRYPDPWDPDWRFGSNDIEDKDNNLPDAPNPGLANDEDPMFANALGRRTDGGRDGFDVGCNRGQGRARRDPRAAIAVVLLCPAAV